ncbi:SusD-like starch-binding protein associating with outer membrane [Mucilaginibacter frigoritolerans]|jgi:hypothetical protein|uniref:SusD-like starch-binding protein associating with outer membrane n=1 Tax=Mucilaginibacter frigoritolerans TaxID=652788 RepID=A0A562TVH1_9SPHI|nr:SusD/RagB family nutrient-binding outer membrane lipoprotein [Mucilaginibacter frigoritolerans]TWI97535.1 SusD-like starch-binding protein associating with outer membrane [Mucilaginibacter frigoritolerans]
MKNIAYKILAFLFVPVMITSCTKNFVKINTNPDATTTVPSGSLLSDALVRTSTVDMESRFNYCHAFMQYGYSSFWSGTTYVAADGPASSLWNHFYNPVLTSLDILIQQTQNDPTQASTYAAARIWRVFIFQKLTDFYGDVPYSQSGLALTQKVYTPAYDAQSAIYASLVTELRASIALLAANSTQTVQGDQFYSGSAAEWKKLGASLLLKVGMRLIKIDPTQAASLAKEAVADGVMTGNSDMPILYHSAQFANGIYTVVQDGVEHFFLDKTLVSEMQNASDPRLPIYGAIYSAPVSQGGTITDDNPADFVGYSFNSSDPAPTVRINAAVFGLQTTPFFDFQYAEVAFLEAEAVVRGYITGDANALYTSGVTAQMQSLALLPTNPTITSAQISAYLTQNPLPTATEDQIARINTEYWLAGFAFDGEDEYANWRRTGYPVLTPNPGSVSQVIPRKMIYPQSEFNLNNANVNAALAQYGGTNTFNTLARVWWDKAN